jgi:hypothetical protein
MQPIPHGNPTRPAVIRAVAAEETNDNASVPAEAGMVPHNPDFLLSLVALRTSCAFPQKKGAHAFLSRCNVQEMRGISLRPRIFLPRSARCGHGCGFLLRKAAASLPE